MGVVYLGIPIWRFRNVGVANGKNGECIIWEDLPIKTPEEVGESILGRIKLSVHNMDLEVAMYDAGGNPAPQPPCRLLQILVVSF
ncbi:hypothetical protein Lal_00021209 [Lupinus albus]|nr:hypothetical protein Lal_00021209 [Lupinus albus]